MPKEERIEFEGTVMRRFQMLCLEWRLKVVQRYLLMSRER